MDRGIGIASRFSKSVLHGCRTVQVARIAVTTPGSYHVHVESHEQNGGWFSIGKPPTLIGPGRNVLRATPFIALFAFLGIVFGIAAMRARSQALRQRIGVALS
ncbi:MAG TPA: hypothetical protein VGI81_02560 [Tepidisphaeraceae bacterium]